MRNKFLFGAAKISRPMLGNLAAYDNTLTAIIPDIYAALDVVSRELVGFIPSAGRAFGAERAAVGQSVVYAVTPALVSTNIVPAMTVPEPQDMAIDGPTMVISKAKAVAVGFTGEEQRGLNTGPGYLTQQAQAIAQGLRTLVNEAEADLAAEITRNASRATGTAGTTPFATDLGASAQLRKILDDNGAPTTGRSMVINTTSGAALRTLSQLTRANEAGTQMTLRQGELLDIHGFSLKESGQIGTFVKGTGASMTTNAAGYAVGATVITLAAIGTGTIKVGDVVSFAGDANRYQVASGDVDVSNGGTITLAKPGLRVAIPAAATAITLTNNYTPNVGFSMDAAHIVMRPPAIPQEGDAAIDSMLVTDPRSGMTFELRVYAGYRKVRIEIGLAWGVKATKPEHIALLLG